MYGIQEVQLQIAEPGCLLAGISTGSQPNCANFHEGKTKEPMVYT